MLQKMRPASSPTDHLFVGTDQYNYFTVSWDASTKQLRTEKSFVDLADKTGRDSQSADRCLVEPMRKHITLELYEGIITVIPVIQKSRKKGDPEIGTLGEAVSVRIPELFVRSSTFLHSRNPDAPKEKPKMLFLYEDNHKKPRLRLRSLDYMAGVSGEPGSAELDELPLAFDDIDPGASHLIPVPAPAHGVLILGETRITYLDEISEDPIIQPLEEATIFVAWEQIDGQRWLLADDFGRLYFLMLLLDGDVVAGWKLDYLGNTSRASCLVYLENGIVFIGSHQGDSQVIRIQEKSIEVVQVLSNIAPILDFTIMDMGSRAGDGQTSEYSSGQARIVTGSGAFQDGSLRSVRSGVGLEELGNLGDLGHVADLFALRSTADTEKSDVLVVSSIGETRIFTFNREGEVEETEDFKGFALNESTLIAKNMAQNRILQVTGTSVRITELEGGMNTASWTPPNGQSILAASSNSRYLALSIGGVEIVILDLLTDLREVSRKTFDLGSQIACIEVPDIFDNICLVGFWQSTTILVLETETLRTVQSSLITEDEMAIPRSILLTQILPDHPPTLFVALADGNVVTFNFDISSYTLSSRKSTILGTQQANFTALPRGEGLFNVFATCEHPSLIYGSEGRIIYSAVTAEKASCICPFDCEAYPGAIAVASSEALKIALVDAERTTHVQTLPIGQTVRRIAYSTNLKAFGIGTIQRTLRGEIEIVQSHFKLADEVVFKELDSYDLNEDELVESVIRADLEEGSKQPVERFVVGTAYLDDERSDSIRGRLIVFEVTQDRKLKVVTELALLGACRALGVLDGNIVAALVKTVSLLSIPPHFLTNSLFSIGRHLRLRIRLPLQSRFLPHLHRPHRPCHHGLPHRHRRPHEKRLHRPIQARQGRRKRHPHRSRPAFPHGLGNCGCACGR